MPHPSIHANVTQEMADAIAVQARHEGTSMSQIIRNALIEYIASDYIEDDVVEDDVVDNVVPTTTEEEEDSMRLNGQIELRFHKNNSGSVSIFAIDPLTGEKLGSIARFNNDGTLRRIQGADKVPGLTTNPRRKNRIALSEESLRRNANR